ncbi:MAG: substrate-binding domain-containing protein [Phycisphaerae bacterium]
MSAECREWDICDGMLTSSFNDDLIAKARSHDIPVVCISAARNEPSIPRVLADSREIGRMTARYFLQQGFKQFLYVGLSGHWFASERLAGFQEVLAEKNLSCTNAELQTGNRIVWQKSIGQLVEPLTQAPKPLAAMGCSDAQAATLVDLCRELDIRVPDDVSVLGVDNELRICEFSRPRISSIDPNFTRVGYLAADLLEKLMAGKDPPAEPILIPPKQLVVRTSSDTLAIDDPVVVEAMRAIRRRASEPIRVDDVVEEVPLSRRPLETRFRRATGRTIAQEIMSAHVGRARELLVTSDLTVLDVALASGFRSQQHLSQVFRKHLGCSPNGYRRQHRSRPL